mmetsp:Transcript_23270/g.42186  ORF Transcript_23270/g.42186 Transcript_23270/m.42186 type:complete len:222 (+) Transcript_23270:959-1624(+)
MLSEPRGVTGTTKCLTHESSGKLRRKIGIGESCKRIRRSGRRLETFSCNGTIHGSLASCRAVRLTLDMEETLNVGRAVLVHVRAWRHLSLAGNFAKAKVVELTLEGGKLRVTKVPVQDFSLETFRAVNLDPPVRPLNYIVVVVLKHLGQLVQKLCNGMMRRVALITTRLFCCRRLVFNFDWWVNSTRLALFGGRVRRGRSCHFVCLFVQVSHVCNKSLLFD